MNRFASRTIPVEASQKVISDGPSRLVRHPMHSGALVMWMSIAPVLGSYVAVLFFALLIPVLVFRLGKEENLLSQHWPGYEMCCQKTRFRLMP